MRSRSPAAVLTLFACWCGGFLFFQILEIIPRPPETIYARLTLPEQYPDRPIREGLPRNTLSESSQWVFLDDFGKLEQIPLDEFPGRLEAFDPRNDGYPEKLRSFFVREGKRFFYIPLPGPKISDPWLNPKYIEGWKASWAETLPDLPFSLVFWGPEQPGLWYCFLFVFASAGALVLSDSPEITGSLLPILGVLAFLGPAGLALDSILLWLVWLIRRRALLWSGILLVLGVPGFLWIPGPALPDLLRISIPAAVSGALFALAAPPGDPHRRNCSAIPFLGLSFIALFPPGEPVFRSPAGTELTVSPEEYARHAAFQASFSFKPLGSQAEGYQRYTLGEDGLIEGGFPYSFTKKEVPAFPLESLGNFLAAFDAPIRKPQGTEKILLWFLAGAWGILGIQKSKKPGLEAELGRKKKQSLMYTKKNEKRIAA